MVLRNQTNLKINVESPHISETNDLQLRPDGNLDGNDLKVEEERKGWKGYVEWERYPEKKAKAHQRFIQYKFPPPPEFQLEPVPATNPVLDGVRWKLWHKAIGGVLTDIPEESWKRVLEVVPNLVLRGERNKSDAYIYITRIGKAFRHATPSSVPLQR